MDFCDFVYRWVHNGEGGGGSPQKKFIISACTFTYLELCSNIQQNFIISNLKGPMLTARYMNLYPRFEINHIHLFALIVAGSFTVVQ